jgi:hypothetical protein
VVVVEVRREDGKRETAGKKFIELKPRVRRAQEKTRKEDNRCMKISDQG